MSEPRRGRPPHSFTIRRVRLVNFHNLVDETVEIREGGHLFLLGDNGSGKTTVLDAVHLALTGALDVELNAAARLAGGREAGRSLQGVVLRYDAEHGVRRAGGAIAYAVLELVDSVEGAVLCAGVGIEATTMDADVSRWALLHRGSLEDLELVEQRAEGRFPISRDELRLALGKTSVYAKMTEYRRALSERAFGGPTLYEEVCRFWSMAKAYREIVARSRDFAGLFVRLLPEPDAGVFTDIMGSLKALDELELLIEQLGRQRAYAAGIADLVEEIGAAREEYARYAFLLELRRHHEAQAHREATARELSAAATEVLDADASVKMALGALQVAREALRSASTGAGAELLDQLRQREAELSRAQGDTDVERRGQRAAEDRRRERSEAFALAFDREQERRRSRSAELRTAAEDARNVIHPLQLVLRAAEEEAGDARADPEPRQLSPVAPQALQESEALLGACLAELSKVESDVGRRSAELELRQSELAALESLNELPPSIAGLQAAREALAAANILVQPLYELLEPAPSASDGDVAAVEDLLGEAALSSLVVAPEQLDAARALALTHEGVRVVIRSANDAPPPRWIIDLLSTSASALGVVGTLLSQAPSLGSLSSPDTLGDLEHRGVALRTGSGAPRLIGIEARRRARETRLQGARQAVAEAERSLALAEAERARARRARQGAERVTSALTALRGVDVIKAHAAVEVAWQSLRDAEERLAENIARFERARTRSHDSEALVLALRARVREEGIAELEQRLQALRETESAATQREAEARRRQAEAMVRQSTLEQQLRATVEDEQRVAALLAERRTSVRTALAALSRKEAELDDAGLERWVRVTMRGDQFARAENIEERKRDADRGEAAACTELEGDGSKGVRNLEWAGRFGFEWSAAELKVVDRRGDPLGGVLTKLDRDLAEQREVAGERTRELMDRLVMGDLARELQGQVERLYRTVREINRLLGELRFGATRYQFKVTPRAGSQELVEIVRKLSALDEASRVKFRAFVDERLEELRDAEPDSDVPELLDYRRWFDYRLSMSSAGRGDVELTRELRSLGSGGEQGVPNYLLVLALAKLMFDNAEARVRPLLFDEAFYGIDAGRRDQLLRFATDLGLQLVVASPDQDGVTPSATCTTTLFLLRDEHGDVHLAPYHYWNDRGVAQKTLFPERAEEPDPNDAICVVASPEAPEEPGSILS